MVKYSNYSFVVSSIVNVLNISLVFLVFSVFRWKPDSDYGSNLVLHCIPSINGPSFHLLFDDTVRVDCHEKWFNTGFNIFPNAYCSWDMWNDWSSFFFILTTLSFSKSRWNYWVVKKALSFCRFHRIFIKNNPKGGFSMRGIDCAH
jgi:hypothetical protein